MIKTSETFDSARSEYIEGYEEKNEHIFPTLSLVAKEFKRCPFYFAHRDEAEVTILMNIIMKKQLRPWDTH